VSIIEKLFLGFVGWLGGEGFGERTGKKIYLLGYILKNIKYIWHTCEVRLTSIPEVVKMIQM